jgi:hypothetical protein
MAQRIAFRRKTSVHTLCGAGTNLHVHCQRHHFAGNHFSGCSVYSFPWLALINEKPLGNQSKGHSKLEKISNLPTIFEVEVFRRGTNSRGKTGQGDQGM